MITGVLDTIFRRRRVPPKSTSDAPVLLTHLTFIMCPSCKYILEHKVSYLVCKTPGCKYRGVRFKIPVVELIRDASDS